MPTMTVISTTMRTLRREGIEIRRRMMTLAPSGLISKNKKPSPPPPYACVLALPAPRHAGGDGARPERAPPSAAISRSGHAHAAAPPSDPAAEVVKNKSIGKGAQVRVRTRVGTAACTGQPIVFWLRAVVDDTAADEDGYLHVTYSYTRGKLPRVARVALSDIRMDDVPIDDACCGAASSGGSSSSAVTSDDRSARPPQQNKAAPRPTVAGKKLPLLKKYEKEMKSRSKAIVGFGH